MKNIYSIENGLVATTPRHMVTQDGLPITSFRLVDTVTKPARGGTVEQTHNNWITVTAFGAMAVEMSVEVSKGARIDITGLLYIRDWDNGERSGTSVELEATEYKLPQRSNTHNCTCPHCTIR